MYKYQEIQTHGLAIWVMHLIKVCFFSTTVWSKSIKVIKHNANDTILVLVLVFIQCVYLYLWPPSSSCSQQLLLLLLLLLLLSRHTFGTLIVSSCLISKDQNDWERKGNQNVTLIMFQTSLANIKVRRWTFFSEIFRFESNWKICQLS